MRGLKRRERNYLLLLAPFSMALFAGGAAFAYFGLAPFFFNFLLEVGGNIDGVQLEPSLENTVGLLVSLMFSLGLVFQIPLMMLALTKTGLVKTAWFAGKFRWVVLVAFLMGAALTPTVDPFTQIMVAVPIMLLFGVGLGLSWLLARPKPEPTTAPPEPERNTPAATGG